MSNQGLPGGIDELVGRGGAGGHKVWATEEGRMGRYVEMEGSCVSICTPDKYSMYAQTNA